VNEDSIALHFLVILLVDDVSILEVEGAKECLRYAAVQPLQWLWLEQRLHQHGLSPAIVWQVIYPHTEFP
jgi:hypothetical protein